jgi:hypothetical protein
MSIPDAKYEHDWSGLHVVRIKKCEHDRHAAMKTV